MEWVDDLVENYNKWLKDKTTIKSDDLTGWTTISTPYIGLFNDTIEIFAKRKSNEEIQLSDDEQTLHNLELSGVSISRSPKRKEIVEKILLNYGIHQNGNELHTTANMNNFAQKKHNFLSAISEINDLSVFAKHTIASVFKDDVKEYLDSQEIIYTPQFISKGSTGIEFTFDFQIAHKEKEIVIKSFNSLNKFNLPNFLFTWQDIKELRENITQKKLVSLAIINNTDNPVRKEYLDALKSKGSDFILWDKRNDPANIRKMAA